MKNILLIAFSLMFCIQVIRAQGYGENRDYIRNANEIPELGTPIGTIIRSVY